MPDAAPATADPAVSTRLMLATYVAGGAGIAVGLYTLQSQPPSLSLACLLAVGVTGLLSFLRHAVFHRSDAARMGWDYGQRNNFQIEVGLANLSWGLVGILAVVLGWGLAAEAVTFLVFGVYLMAVVVLNLTSGSSDGRRPVGPLIGLGSFGMMLLVVGTWGVTVA